MKKHFNKSFQIGNKTVSEDSNVFIIAEAGVNHCGDMDMAYKMIDVAAESGSDAIKFQSFKADSLILKDVDMADYQKTALKSNKTQYQMLKELELNIESAEKLKKQSEEAGLIFLTTPFDYDSFKELIKLDLAAYKIASTDTTNIEFIKTIAMQNKPLIISTGMTHMSEISLLLNELKHINKDIVLLQCTSNYPLDDSEVNLNVINTFKDNFDCLVGFSDHSIGIQASQLSVGIGSVMIEKHFTLDKNLPGPDHSASLDPEELIKFVKSIRSAEVIMGSSLKMPTISEIRTRASLQKSIVALQPIKKGNILNDKNLGCKRSGGEGIPAIYLNDLFGLTATRDYSIDDLIIK